MTDVLSKNLFDLLGDDGEEGVARPQPVKKDAAAPAPVQQQQQKKDQQVNRAPRNEYRPRGGAGGQPRGDRIQRNGGPRETGDFERPPREGQREGQVDGQRGGYRGGRGGRGGPRGGGAGARGREFDRRSGTGRRDTEKKEVAGKGSWGNPVTAEEEGSKVAEQEIAAADGTATPEENAAGADAAAEPETPKEPEEVLKTLDQYFAEVQAKKGAQEANVRKANEGADESQWKDAVVFEKKEEEEYFVGGKSKGKKAAAVAQTPKEKAQKVFAAIEQRFADEPKRGGREGGRGGRGGGRGQGGDRPDSGRGRGGQNNRRGGRAAAGGDANVNVADERAFPSLGGK